MVDALEQELGTVLLNRSTRQVTFTEAGAAYYQSARQVLEYLAEADASVMDGGDEPSGPLRVSVPTAFGRRMISPHIGTLLARHPAWSWTSPSPTKSSTCSASGSTCRSASGGCAHGRRGGQDPRRIPSPCSGKPGLPRRAGTPAQPLELAEHDCLRFNYGAARQVWTFQGPEGEVRVPVRGRMRSNNIEVLREVALAGSAVALLPDWLVDDDIAAGRLLSLFPGSGSTRTTPARSSPRSTCRATVPRGGSRPSSRSSAACSEAPGIAQKAKPLCAASGFPGRRSCPG